MPNHVHVLLRPLAPHSLDAILHSWKSYSATAINRLLARRGAFWMPEYHDHRYILNNPAKAHLLHWPWSGTHLETPISP